MMKPYWSNEQHGLSIYLGDCLAILPQLGREFDLCLTDPPYPNNAGYFDDGIQTARTLLATLQVHEVLVFWSELEWPTVDMPRVAQHIWHRTNVNGRPYESMYHFAQDGTKRRSTVRKWAAVFGGVGPGCWEYIGHPTQKPVGLIEWLLTDVLREQGTVLDPFLGSGTTLVACYRLGRQCVGIEISEKYCELAAKRLEEAMQQGRLFEPAETAPKAVQGTLEVEP